MTEIRTPDRDAAERLAAVRAARVPVDNQGRPLAAPSVYTYDGDGRLVSAEPGTEDATP